MAPTAIDATSVKATARGRHLVALALFLQFAVVFMGMAKKLPDLSDPFRFGLRVVVILPLLARILPSKTPILRESGKYFKRNRSFF